MIFKKTRNISSIHFGAANQHDSCSTSSGLNTADQNFYESWSSKCTRSSCEEGVQGCCHEAVWRTVHYIPSESYRAAWDTHLTPQGSCQKTPNEPRGIQRLDDVIFLVANESQKNQERKTQHSDNRQGAAFSIHASIS